MLMLKIMLTESSKTSIEVLPLFHGISRSTNGSIRSESSLISDVFNEDGPIDLKQAVQFLHADNAFFEAASTGNHNRLETLISANETNIYQLNQLGRSALHLAACSENEHAVKLLLEAGLSPNTKDLMGMTPLSLCLLMKPSLGIVKLLFDYGANIPRRIDAMDTGLFIQFITLYIPTPEYEKIIVLLVEKGALVNDRSAPGGRQALHIAAMGNNCHLIKLLVELGAKIHVQNHRGQTPKEFASIFKCKEAVALFEKLDELSRLSSPLSSSNDNSLFTKERTSSNDLQCC